MNKICTTIEQSKKLLELGIDRKSSDMYYWCGEDLRIGGHRAQDEELDISAWSLSALLSLYNNCELSKERIEKDGSDDRYWLHDDNFHKFSNEYDNPFDAVFEMVCWLKENGKL